MRILIVEDDLFFQKLYHLKLEEQKHIVEIASNGEEALVKLPTFKPDIILLDLIMPKKDGFDVLSALRENQEWKKIPVLVFSTLGQESDIAKAKELGASDFINKSFFNIEVLLQKINQLTAHT